MAKPTPNLDERVSIPLDPETALRGLVQVDPDVGATPRCPKKPDGKPCILDAGHFGPCQYVAG
jgi:hypothetical protein